jgi:transmembrane sensor
MYKDEDVKRILRQLNGEAGDEETKIFEQWLSDNPKNRAVYEEISSIWNMPMNEEPLFSESHAESMIDEIIYKYNSKVKLLHLVRSAVAVFLLLLAIGGAVFYQSRNSPSPDNGLVDSHMIVMKAGVGEQVKVILPDSSMIWLNALSSLSYPEHFSKENREVKLTGEAFFNVHHDKSRPFSIHSKGITTKVLGTSFNIRAFHDENVTVTVVSGSVSVENDFIPSRQPLRLEPGKQAVYELHNASFSIRDVDPENFYAWTHGMICFNNDSLSTVTKILERWYGVSIVLKGNVNNKIKINGRYKNKDLRAILDGLQFMYDLSCEYPGKDTILISQN